VVAPLYKSGEEKAAAKETANMPASLWGLTLVSADLDQTHKELIGSTKKPWSVRSESVECWFCM
jgi:hypothetical protein